MGWVVAVIAVIGLSFISILFLFLKPTAQPVPQSVPITISSAGSATNVPQQSSQNASPLLELVSTVASRQYMIQVEGQVKNISQQSLKSVTVVVSCYDANGAFVTSQNAMIQYNPILPNQVSPFIAYINNNPAIVNYKIEFKELSGGALAAKNSTGISPPFKIAQ